MNIVGDLKKFTQFESADNISTAAANEGGMAGMGASMGAGMGMAQAMMGSMSQASSSNKDEDPLALIEKLAKLKDMGAITEEEFSAKKKELLSKL